MTYFHRKAWKHSSKWMKLIQSHDWYWYIASDNTNEHICQSFSHILDKMGILKTSRHPEWCRQFYSLKQCCHLAREMLKSKFSFSRFILSDQGFMRHRGRESARMWIGHLFSVHTNRSLSGNDVIRNTVQELRILKSKLYLQ